MNAKLNEKITASHTGLSLKHNMMWNSFGSIFYLACQWVITSVLVVRLTDGFVVANALGLASATYSIFMPLAIYRMYTYQISDVKHENSLGEYFTLRLITSAAAFTGCVCYAAVFTTSEMLVTIVLYASYKSVSLMIDVFHGTDQLNRRMDYIGKSFILQGASSLVAFCVIFYPTQNLDISLVAMTVTTALVAICYDYPRARQFESFHIGISRKKALGLLGSCLPIVIAAIACAAVPSIPRQVLESTHGGALLGIYASVAAPVTIIQMGASYIYGPLISVFSEQYANNQAHNLIKMFIKVVVGIGIIGIVCALGFEIAGAYVLTLIFGQSIEPYTYLLLPIVVSMIISAYVWFFGDLLVALRCFKGSFVGNIAAAAAALPTALLFVSVFDMNGVSFAIIAAYSIGAILMAGYLIALFRKSLHKERE